MKKISTILTIMLTVCFASAQTVDEIISKHLEAAGGIERLSKLNSSVTTGSINITSAVKMNFYTTLVQNKLMNDDKTIEDAHITMIITPAGGRISAMGQITEMPAESFKDSAKITEELNIQDPFLFYKEKGVAAELLGKVDVGGIDCYEIKLSKPNRSNRIIYIDPATYLITKG